MRSSAFYSLCSPWSPAFYVVRAVRNFEGDVESLVHIVLPALFGLVMGYFGVSSFLRARKITRS